MELPDFDPPIFFLVILASRGNGPLTGMNKAPPQQVQEIVSPVTMHQKSFAHFRNLR
jgi:hypothetical protein